MLPNNNYDRNQAGAPPISSNGVIYQGPDIPCISLCKGDTISDVTAKLAQQICDLVDQTDLDTFTLTCFGPVCPTLENFHDLIQLLVDKICALQETIDNPPVVPVVDCPSCLIDVDPKYNLPPYNLVDNFGRPITQMQLKDYTTFIASTVL